MLVVPVVVGRTTTSPAASPESTSVWPLPVTPVVTVTTLVVLPLTTVAVLSRPTVVIALLATRSTFCLLDVVIVAVADWPNRRLAGGDVSEMVTP